MRRAHAAATLLRRDCSPAAVPPRRTAARQDFGRVTYYSDVAALVEKAGLSILEDDPIPGSINNASQTARLLVLKATSATKKD